MAEHGLPTGQIPPAQRVAPRVRAVIAVLVAAGVAAASYWTLTPTTPPAPPPRPDLAALGDDADEPFAVVNPGYLGPQACAPCHAARVTEFERTAHARACRRPTDGPMPPGFDPGRGTYVTADPGLRFEMARRGDEFFQTAVQRTPDGERRSTARIDLVYGAHQADEVFFSWRGDRLYELMTVWLHPSHEWANTPYDRHGSGGFARETTTRCLECHNTWFAHVPGTTNQYRPDSFVLGVTCERCHGPGKDHVAFHQAHPEAPAHAIVQPATLDRDRLTEVCTQCHGNYTKPRGPTFSYRPGRPLADYYRLAETTHPEQDHVANQVKYLRESKCYQQSDSLTCTTCHDPHRPHEPGQSAAGLRSCLKCHQPEACGDRPNLPAAVRDDCTGCHMRKQVWMNVHFHTADDRYAPPIRRSQHRIGIDPVARKEVLLAWHRSQPGGSAEADRLAGELADHWLGEVEARRGQYRFLAAVGAAREALRVDPPPDKRAQAAAALRDAIGVQTRLDDDLILAYREADSPKPEAAVRLLDRILTIKPDLAAARHKLGALHARAGRLDLAIPHLESVARDDPDNAQGLALLGWLAYLAGRAEEATEYYRRAERIEPFSAKIRFHWGLALLQLRRWAEAEDRFRRALEADPNHAGALQGLAHALRADGRAGEAVRPAWRAARLTGFNEPDVLVTLADVYADAGRPAEAAAAATKVIELDVAGAGATRLPFDVRGRMERLRAGR